METCIFSYFSLTNTSSVAANYSHIEKCDVFEVLLTILVQLQRIEMLTYTELYVCCYQFCVIFINRICVRVSYNQRITRMIESSTMGLLRTIIAG